MPTTKIGKSYIDPRLTNVARLDFANYGFIHQDIFPEISNLGKKTGKVARMGNEHMRIFGTTKRSSYDEGNHRIDFKYQDDDSYEIDSHDVEVFLPRDFIDQADQPFNAENDARVFLEGVRNVIMEKAVAERLNNPAIITANSTPAALWSDYVNSTPLFDLEVARFSVEDAVGMPPNRCIIQNSVISTLKTHPEFIAKMAGFNSPKTLNTSQILQILQDHLELPTLPLVGRAKYISTAPGQSETRTAIWNPDVVLYYAPFEGSTLWAPALGYRLTRGGLVGSKKVYSSPHPTKPRLGKIIEMEWEYQDLMLDVSNAYLLDGVK